MGRKTYIDKDFQVTPEHRNWSMDKGWPLNLPDVFLHEFKEHFDEKRDSKDKSGRHINWNSAFKRWIGRSSPTGRFYRPWFWEQQLMKAKELESQKFKRTAPEPYYDEAHRKTPMPDSTRQIVERMRLKK